MPERSMGEPQAHAKHNHDNPVSGNHPGTVTLNSQWNIEYLPRGRGGTGAKLDINRGAVHLLRPCKTVGPPHLN